MKRKVEPPAKDQSQKQTDHIPQVGFFEFVYIWLRQQGLQVPAHQRKIAFWLSALWEDPENRQGLLMAFRNSGKSTLVGLFCAWLLYRRPSERILVMAADHALAKKMVRNVKRIIERHYLTPGLKPARQDQWASDQFTVNRDQELRDPSMLAKGLGANITGLRADVIICDDVEVPKNCDTAVKRRELRSRLDELDYILTPGGLQLYIGTPHHFYTIYQTGADPDRPECEPYLLGFRKLLLPLLDANGRSNWPERFSETKIASIRARSGESKFLSQMMLQPVNLTDCRLNPDRLTPYREEISLSSANGRTLLKIGDIRMMSASCWWDPSFALAGRGDHSVIACVFSDADGGFWLHDLQYLQVPADQADNAASLQCEQVVDFMQRNHLGAVRVEANGIGRFLPGILKKVIRRRGLRLAVIEVYSSVNKQQRILQAFEVLLAEKALKVHQKIWSTGFIEEMREWTPEAYAHDDALDAVAGCLSHEPLRLPEQTAVLSEPVIWQGGGKAYRADDTFEI